MAGRGVGEGVAGQSWGGGGGKGAVAETLLPLLALGHRADRALWLGGATIVILITVACTLYAFIHYVWCVSTPLAFSRDRNPLFLLRVLG